MTGAFEFGDLDDAGKDAGHRLGICLFIAARKLENIESGELERVE